MVWHCEQAGRLREAALYAIKAAEACSIRSAVTEAHRLLSSAETYLSDGVGSSDSDDLMLRLLATRGPIVMALYGDASTRRVPSTRRL
jgi:hypothetical protein